LERRPVGLNQPIGRYADDEGDIEPVDMLVPVRPGNGLFGDVRLLGIVLLVTIWLCGLCHIRWRLRSVLWWRSHLDECYGEGMGDVGREESWVVRSAL